MMRWTYAKEFSFMNAHDIEEILKKSPYAQDYEWLDTGITSQNHERIKPTSEFEEQLVQKKIYYFAYIKFFIDNQNSYGIVGGKTKSRLVNEKRGSDVDFTKDLRYAPLTKWNAKEFLTLNGLEWNKGKILIVRVRGNHENLQELDKKARKIERDLQNWFGLFGS